MALPIAAIDGLMPTGAASPLKMSGFDLHALANGDVPDLSMPMASPQVGTIGAPDLPSIANPPAPAAPNPFQELLGAAEKKLESASKMENAVANHKPGANIVSMAIEEAEAQRYVQIAAAAASKLSQSASTILNMQM